MEVDKMPAGRELDALVAEKVMGWTKGLKPWLMPPCFVECDVVPIPNYSTDIAAAFLVAEKIDLFKNCRSLRENAVGVRDGNTWRKTGYEWVVEQVFCPLGDNEIIARGATAPLAICRGALVAAEDLAHQSKEGL